jgi:hypothetical protein
MNFLLGKEGVLNGISQYSNLCVYAYNQTSCHQGAFFFALVESNAASERRSKKLVVFWQNARVSKTRVQ